MMEEISIHRRPSLYAAIRLARMVQDVRERLKARVLSRAKRDAMLQCEALETCSMDKAWRQNTIARARDIPTNLQKKRKLYRAVARRNNNFTSLLQDFDGHVSPGGLPLSVVAAKDTLFLKHSVAEVDLKHIKDASHVLDLSTLLIERLRYARNERVWGNAEYKHLDRLECEKYMANLEHLLLCFQYAALESLIHHSLYKLQSDYQHWDQYLEQQRRVNDGCVSEYSGRPPLSTTMPWNIKPSLMVLWGVCWMFYTSMNNSNDSAGSPTRAGQVQDAEGAWNQQQQQQQQQQQHQVFAYASPSPNMGQRTDGLRHSPNQATHDHLHALGLGLSLHVTEPYHVTNQFYPTSDSAMSHALLGGSSNSPTPLVNLAPVQASATLPSQPQSAGYINTANLTPSSSSDGSFATLSPAWPQDPGCATSFGVSHTGWQPSPDQGNISTPATANYSFPQSATSITSRATQFEISSSAPASSGAGYNTRVLGQQAGAGYQPFNLGLAIPMQDSQAYSSSHSEASARSVTVCPVNMVGSVSPIMQHESSPSAGYSPTNSGGGFPPREPPRDQDGHIFCDHAECAQILPTFSRKCEWSKHVDKHTRPYVCRQPGCEKIRGFTYSGGLLRHEREVHKKYGGPKAPRFCPHRDCKRSTGTGFSRKENLHEHLRRVHRGVGISEDDAVTPVDEQSKVVKKEANAATHANTALMTLDLSSSLKKRKLNEAAKAEEESLSAKGVDGNVGRDSSPGSNAEALWLQNKKLRMELEATQQKLKFMEDLMYRGMNGPGMNTQMVNMSKSMA